MATATIALDPAHLLSVMTGDPRVSVPLVDLAAALELSPGDLALALDEARRLDWLTVWETPKDGRLVAITPIIAERLGRKMDDSGRRWESADRPRKKRSSTRSAEKLARETATNDSLLSAIPDRTGPVLDALIRREEAEARATKDRTLRSEQKPLFLIGTSLIWEGPYDPDEACPACDDRRLGPLAYCLLCDSPMGTLAGRARAAVRRREVAKKKARKLAGGMGKRAG